MAHKKSRAARSLTARYTAAAAHARSESRVCCMREPLNDLDDTGTNLGGEISQQLLLLLDEIGRNPRTQPLSLTRGVDQHRAAIGRVRSRLDVSLPHQGVHDAAGGALVQKQPLGQSTQ